MEVAYLKKGKNHIPHIGLRIIKSSVGVFFCFLIYILRRMHGAPFYSALAVLWCIQSHPKDSVAHALQRTIGTLIGALYGFIFILLKIQVGDTLKPFWHYLAMSMFIIPVIYTTVLIHKKNASYFSCVVYLSIVVNHLGDANPFLFVLDRSIDTLIGIAVGLFVNLIHIHGKLQKNVLFAVDMDNVLDDRNENLSSYSRFYLKYLLENGMNLVFMTLRTPASFLEALPDIRPGIPIIAMDGAILYDINENSYPKVYEISSKNADRIEGFIRECGFNLFTTVIIDDVLLIYYDEPQNDAEKNIYDTLHRSPYRNYLNKRRPSNHSVVYFMTIAPTEDIRILIDKMKNAGITCGLKMLYYPSDDYPGYSYLKLYNGNVRVNNMIDYLKEMYGLETVTTVGVENSRYDVMYHNMDSNQMVRKLGYLYFWAR